jgi:hypothetical protein
MRAGVCVFGQGRVRAFSANQNFADIRMIGVAVHPTEQDVVGEFFELFKTPWEFHRNDAEYDVLICTRKQVPQNAAKIILHYSAEAIGSDAAAGLSLKARSGGRRLIYKGRRIPIYGGAATFPGSQFAPVVEEDTGEPVTFTGTSGGRSMLRIGYDLFKETNQILNTGQPAANAGSATLELHIALLRDLITKSGLPVVEIPPVPEKHKFIICLTHDIDHPVLRNHCCDRTMVGFLYRATIGTIINFCCGRKSLRDLCANWVAALKLPFVYLGVARDFWRGFDRYLEMEAGLGSTYFVVPSKDYPGRPFAGKVASQRAVRYDVADVRLELQKVISSGGEVGLHGMDAWVDSTQGREECNRVSQTLDATVTGVRMHWLFFDGNSPAVLDQAGFSYDSTIGYNETVGYRAGTGQVYRPPGSVHLLELPLQIMDTALFYPGYLNLSEPEAERMVWKLIDGATEFGGALTINWHDRSIAPERLWGGFYLKLLQELKSRGAWFATAAQTVSWFRKRRSAVVGFAPAEDGKIRIQASVKPDSGSPGLKVRVHKPQTWNGGGEAPDRSSPSFVDMDLTETIDTEIQL